MRRPAGLPGSSLCPADLDAAVLGVSRRRIGRVERLVLTERLRPNPIGRDAGADERPYDDYGAGRRQIPIAGVARACRLLVGVPVDSDEPIGIGSLLRGHILEGS